MSLKYVLINKYCAESGYSEKAVRRKIEEGIWLEGQQFRTAPDRHLMIDVESVAALEARDRLATCGVYLLCSEGVPVYVGRSATLPSRLAAHRKSGRPFDEVRIISCDEQTSIWLERELIRTLHPVQNLVRYARHARAMEPIL